MSLAKAHSEKSDHPRSTMTNRLNELQVDICYNLLKFHRSSGATAIGNYLLPVNKRKTRQFSHKKEF